MQEAIIKQIHYHPKHKHCRPKIKTESNVKVVIPNIITQYKTYKKKKNNSNHRIWNTEQTIKTYHLRHT